MPTNEYPLRRRRLNLLAHAQATVFDRLGRAGRCLGTTYSYCRNAGDPNYITSLCAVPRVRKIWCRHRMVVWRRDAQICESLFCF